MSFATVLINGLRKLVYNSELDGDSNAIRAALKQCNVAIRKIDKALEVETSIPQKAHLTTCLGQAKSFRDIIKAMVISGDGYTTRKETARDRVKWESVRSAFKTRVQSAVITNMKHTDPRLFLEDCSVIFQRRIQDALRKNIALKVNTSFCGLFIKESADIILEDIKFISTKNYEIYQSTDLKKWFKDNVQEQILREFDEFQERGSNWALKSIINLQVNINKLTPLLGSSYIDLPQKIKRKEACVNVQNQDQACFAWAVVSALHPANRNSNRVASYPHYSRVLNMAGIQFPMTLKQIPRFQRQNNISINVYILKKTVQEFEVLPVFLADEKKEKHINLLMVQDQYYSEDEIVSGNIAPTKYHYVWIKNLSRLVFSQLSKNCNKKYVCDRCFHYYHSKEKLDLHSRDCKKLNDCVVPKVPTEDKKLIRFKNYNNKQSSHFVVYADTECLLVPINDSTGKKSQEYQKHVPYSVGYYVKCSYDDGLSYYRSYTGHDCMQWFIRELHQLAEDVETVFLCPLPMEQLTSEQLKEYYEGDICHICENVIQQGQKKVRDHCHVTGKYRGIAHEDCNINFQDSHIIPVVLHNMGSYDGHLIIEALAEVEGKIELLPVNKENYISFTKKINNNLVSFRFIDSFRFLASSLDKLASNLDAYPILKSEFLNITEEQFNLLCRKGVFPYDYMDNWSKLKEECLPPKKQFYNHLNGVNITSVSYEHAQEVWKSFSCNTLQDYSDLYLKTDVLLLADVFEQFRKTSMKTYNLAVEKYYTLPGYTWDCMLKYTNIELELLTDIDMVMFIEQGIRGGLSQCSKRFAKANNKYMPEYDPTKEDVYLMYFDINNQYGWAMSQYLPYGGFKWLEEADIINFKLENIDDTADEGYILQVDLEIPKELHNKLADLPPCPEHYDPARSFEDQGKSKNKKLLATLFDKHEYILHYRNLKQVLKLGVKLKKIHRILKFNQAPWLKPYIDLNTKLRQTAKNDFEKNLFKLMNNAVFGKTMENIRKHSNIKLITKWDTRYGAAAYIANPLFKSITIFHENLVAIELSKTKVYFNKPIYVGMCILDLAKTTIYDFHYNYMQERFAYCVPAYTDTDSLVYEIKHEDVYNILKQDCYEHFDTSDYPENNRYHIPRVNKKVLGMMKDENNGRIMTCFIGLRAKMYCLKVQRTKQEENQYREQLEDKGICDKEMAMLLSNQGIMKKIKGIKKSVIKSCITFDDYLHCLEKDIESYVEQNLIKSKNHVLYSIQQTKKALSPYDDKRHLIEGSVNTLPLGHYSLNI